MWAVEAAVRAMVMAGCRGEYEKLPAIRMPYPHIYCISANFAHSPLYMFAQQYRK
jgi:hypothetical protein